MVKDRTQKAFSTDARRFTPCINSNISFQSSSCAGFPVSSDDVEFPNDFCIKQIRVKIILVRVADVVYKLLQNIFFDYFKPLSFPSPERFRAFRYILRITDVLGLAGPNTKLLLPYVICLE